MPLSQDLRFLTIKTPLDDALLLLAFTGHEELSRPFRFELDLVSENNTIDFASIVGQNVTFGVRFDDSGDPRYFNGYVSRFAQEFGSEGYPRYRAEVVPWLWFLTRTADCKIFQNLSVPDIVKQVFSAFGFNDFEFQLQSEYSPLEYCVQYRETAFNFVSRLFEENGIFYFFRHENGKHTLVAGDHSSVHKPCPKQSTVNYYGTSGAGTKHSEEGIEKWEFAHQLRSGRYQLNDYNFEQPSFDLQASANGLVNEGGNQTWEIYDYPGNYGKLSDGQNLADVRMDEEEAMHAVGAGSGNTRSFCAGFKFTLKALTRADQNASYTLVSVAHSASQEGNYAGIAGAQPSYQNTFLCIPDSVRFRPPRMTPKPVVQGSQTAVVVGPSGEEIYTDQYGRVKVQFNWDRLGKYDENSSCWMRVSQLIAGKGWGAVWTPRIGQEVIVDFLEGNPDRPLITGRLYNADQTVPYTLPDEQTKSTIKSYSSKGGGGFNELRFEDKKGSEQVFINAQKDLHFRTADSRYENVDGSAHFTIGKDQVEQVKGDKHISVSGDHNEKVSGTISIQAGTDLQEKVGQNWAIESGMEIHLKAGMNLVVESGTSLTLKVGGNFISLNPGGVFITGTMVMINSGGAAGSGAGASPESPTTPTAADIAQPGQSTTPPTAKQPPQVTAYSPAAMVLKQASQTGAAFCEH